MGCFLACFGFKNNNKRRKRSRKRLSGQQNHVSYRPLDSDATIELDTTPKQITSDSKLKEKLKEPSLAKIKKKVSFNLNVKEYEPIPNDDDDFSSCKWEFNKQTITTTYPPNYRYQNLNDSYDYEDDELIFEEDDFNFEESDEDGNGYSNESDDDEEPSEENDGRDRSKYVLSVLNPVENLTQWKAVKAKAVRLKPEKENVIMLKQQEKEPSTKKLDFNSLDLKNMRNSGDSIPVDASLSNWLGSLETQRRGD